MLFWNVHLVVAVGLLSMRWELLCVLHNVAKVIVFLNQLLGATLLTMLKILLVLTMVSAAYVAANTVFWRFTNLQRHHDSATTRDILKLESVVADQNIADGDHVWTAPSCSLSSHTGKVCVIVYWDQLLPAALLLSTTTIICSSFTLYNNYNLQLF